MRRGDLYGQAMRTERHGGRYEGQEEGIDHRPAEERERVCIRILLLLLKLLRLRFPGRYVSSVFA